MAENEYGTSFLNFDRYALNYKSPLNADGTDLNYTPIQPNAINTAATAPQQQMTANAIAGGAQALGGIAQGVMGMVDNNAARNEARDIAEMNRKDQLKQQNIENTFRRKQMEQEQQAFELKKQIDIYNQKFTIWQNEFQRNLQNNIKSVQAAEDIFNTYKSSDEKTRKAMMASFGQ